MFLDERSRRGQDLLGSPPARRPGTLPSLQSLGAETLPGDDGPVRYFHAGYLQPGSPIKCSVRNLISRNTRLQKSYPFRQAQLFRHQEMKTEMAWLLEKIKISGFVSEAESLGEVPFPLGSPTSFMCYGRGALLDARKMNALTIHDRHFGGLVTRISASAWVPDLVATAGPAAWVLRNMDPGLMPELYEDLNPI